MWLGPNALMGLAHSLFWSLRKLAECATVFLHHFELFVVVVEVIERNEQGPHMFSRLYVEKVSRQV